MIAGAALVVVGINNGDSSAGSVVLDVPDVVSEATPTTVPPLEVPAERKRVPGGRRAARIPEDLSVIPEPPTNGSPPPE